MNLKQFSKETGIHFVNDNNGNPQKVFFTGSAVTDVTFLFLSLTLFV